MGLLTDGLLFAATLFAGTYCWVLARRVEALKDLDKGLGGAIVRLTRQIELARTTLDEARAAARESRQDLGQLSTRAEAAAGQLRLLLATVQDPGAGASDPRAETRKRADPLAAFAGEPIRADRAQTAPKAAPLATPKAPEHLDPPEPARPAQVAKSAPGVAASGHDIPRSARREDAPTASENQLPEPDAPPRAREEPPLAAVPKPRAMLAAPLHRKPRHEPRGEDEILDALRALAGGAGD